MRSVLFEVYDAYRYHNDLRLHRYCRMLRERDRYWAGLSPLPLDTPATEHWCVGSHIAGAIIQTIQETARIERDPKSAAWSWERWADEFDGDGRDDGGE